MISLVRVRVFFVFVLMSKSIFSSMNNRQHTKQDLLFDRSAHDIPGRIIPQIPASIGMGKWIEIVRVSTNNFDAIECLL